MDFPLDLPSTSVPYPFSENVIKLEPLNQLSEPENVEERARALYHHSSDFVQELTRSLSPPPPPPLLNTNAPEKGTDTRSSSPGARTVEMSTQHEAGDEQQLPLSDMTESAIEIQPTTVEVYASQHSSSSSDVLNLPPNQSAAGKDMTQVVGSRLSEAEIQPSIVEVYSTSTVHTNQPQLDLVSHNVGTNQVIGKEGEKEHENVAAPSPTGDQIGDIAMHIVSSPDSSQNLSQEVGPSSWSDSQKRSQDSDVLYSSDSQPPSLKMIRLESPSPTPESSLSPSVVQTDTHSQRQDPEPCHSTIESTPSLLVAQMEAQLPHQQVLEHPDAMNSSPLSQLIAEMDAQPSLQQQDSAHGRMECSSSGGFLYSPPPDGGEEKEGERERIKAPVVAREREESHDKINSGGALRRGDDGRIQLLSMFARSEDYKHKLTAGQWVKADEAASRRGERSTSSSEQRSATKGQSSKSVATVAERPFTSSEQRSRDDESRESHHSGNNLDEGAANLDVPGTQEVDVVGTASQLATLEVDVEGSYSSADKMETAGAAPLRDRPITSPTQVQVQPSATAKGTADKVVESAKEREEKSRIINSKKMSLAKSKKEVHKKDSTGNITMETPHHSQPPFQPKQKSPELYSQEYLCPTSNDPSGGSTSTIQNASSSRNNIDLLSKNLSNLGDRLSKKTVNSVGPTSKALTTQDDCSHTSPSKHIRDISTSQSGPSTSGLSRNPLVQTVLLSKGSQDSSKQSDPSTQSDPSNKTSRDLFTSSNPSSSNVQNKETLLVRSSSTKGKVPSNSKNNLPFKRGGPSATQISSNVRTRHRPLRNTSPPSPSFSSSEKSHSRSASPSARQISPDFEPYVRVFDPVYHDDPQLERWRQLMQAHWFEVKMVKSRQPLTMAEKRSLKQFSLLDNYNQ